MLEHEQKLQETQYQFPYHYISSVDDKGFQQSVTLSWGVEYLSYIQFVIDLLKPQTFSTLIDVDCGDGRFIYEAQQAFSQWAVNGS